MKLWSETEVLTASDLNALVGTTIPRFATAAQRSAAIGSPEAGQLSYITSIGLQMYTGSAWKTLLWLPPGGTAGQVLKKISSADGDAGWANP